MMPALLASIPIGIMMGSWKNPLPCPFSTRVWVFALQRIRQRDATEIFLKIFLVLATIRLHMSDKRLLDRCGQHRVAVFVAFAGSNNNLVPRIIDIFDPEMAAFHQSQTTAVQKNRHQTWQAVHLFDHFLNFFLREHNRKSLRPLRADNPVNQSDLFPSTSL